MLPRPDRLLHTDGHPAALQSTGARPQPGAMVLITFPSTPAPNLPPQPHPSPRTIHPRCRLAAIPWCIYSVVIAGIFSLSPCQTSVRKFIWMQVQGSLLFI